MTQTQLLDEILGGESFKSIDQNQSFQDFLNARQNDLDESEISERYRTLEGQTPKFKGCMEGLSNTVYEDWKYAQATSFTGKGSLRVSNVFFWKSQKSSWPNLHLPLKINPPPGRQPPMNRKVKPSPGKWPWLY
jgi:hypothetical protein